MLSFHGTIDVLGGLTIISILNRTFLHIRGYWMHVLRCVVLPIFILGMMFQGCDSPVQTELKLDSWQNIVLSKDMQYIQNPACSPDGKTIAFSRRHQVFSILSRDLTGNTLDTLFTSETDLASWPSIPQISPDGDQVVYHTRNNQIIIENIQSGNKTVILVPSPDETAREPKWSSDGQFVYYKINNDYIEKSSTDGIVKSRIDLGNSFDHINAFQLLPDGHTLLLSASDNTPNNDYNIYLFDSITGDLDKLTNTLENSLMPAWSPDGESMVYFQYDSLGRMCLVQLDRNGTNADTLVDNQFINTSFPYWSSDGDRIIFWGAPYTSAAGMFVYSISKDTLQFINEGDYKYDLLALDPSNDNRIYTYDVEYVYSICTITLDSVVTRVSPFLHYSPVYPEWTPDGEYILYLDDNLYKVTAQGGVPKNVANYIFSRNMIDISPDGQYIALGQDYQDWNRGSDNSYHSIDILNFETLYPAFTIMGKNCPSWSPDSKRLVCFDNDGLYIYQFNPPNSMQQILNDMTKNIEFVAWSPVQTNLGYDILYAFSKDDQTRQLVVVDDQLQNRVIIDKDFDEYKCAWMANGTELIHVEPDYNFNLFIRSLYTEF